MNGQNRQKFPQSCCWMHVLWYKISVFIFVLGEVFSLRLFDRMVDKQSKLKRKCMSFCLKYRTRSVHFQQVPAFSQIISWRLIYMFCWDISRIKSQKLKIINIGIVWNAVQMQPSCQKSNCSLKKSQVLWSV